MTFSWYPLLATTPIACRGVWSVVGRIDRDSTDRDEDAMEAVDRSRVADLIIVGCVMYGMVWWSMVDISD
jgi:hypothetical protein